MYTVYDDGGGGVKVRKAVTIVDSTLAVVTHVSRVQSAPMGLFSKDCRQHEAPVPFVWHGAAETSKQTSHHQARDRLFALTFGRCFARMLLISLNDSTVSGTLRESNDWFEQERFLVYHRTVTTFVYASSSQSRCILSPLPHL
jgi:hypothetical protein